MAIQDLAMGLVPHDSPTKYVEHEAGEIIYRGQPVKLNTSGTIEDAVQTANNVLGVAMNHAASGGKVMVSVDPDTIYEATAEEAAIQADVGKFVVFTDSNAVHSNGELSKAVLDLSAATNTIGVHYMQVVGLPTKVTNAAVNLKVLVKLITTQWDDAITIA